MPTALALASETEAAGLGVPLAVEEVEALARALAEALAVPAEEGLAPPVAVCGSEAAALALPEALLDASEEELGEGEEEGEGKALAEAALLALAEGEAPLETETRALGLLPEVTEADRETAALLLSVTEAEGGRETAGLALPLRVTAGERVALGEEVGEGLGGREALAVRVMAGEREVEAQREALPERLLGAVPVSAGEAVGSRGVGVTGAVRERAGERVARGEAEAPDDGVPETEAEGEYVLAGEALVQVLTVPVTVPLRVALGELEPWPVQVPEKVGTVALAVLLCDGVTLALTVAKLEADERGEGESVGEREGGALAQALGLELALSDVEAVKESEKLALGEERDEVLAKALALADGVGEPERVGLWVPLGERLGRGEREEERVTATERDSRAVAVTQ